VGVGQRRLLRISGMDGKNRKKGKDWSKNTSHNQQVQLSLSPAVRSALTFALTLPRADGRWLLRAPQCLALPASQAFSAHGPTCRSRRSSSLATACASAPPPPPPRPPPPPPTAHL
jgi:hypothetical protein